MSILSDYHVHSHHSGDSDEAMENIVNKAISLGYKNICFTEHQDIDFKGYTPEDDGMFDLNTDSYLYELLKLRAKYEDKINVLFGVEIGMQPHLRRELAVYSKNHDFDFVIASVHVINQKDPYYRDLFSEYTDTQLFDLYFKETMECLKVFTNFDVLGHLDYVVRYGANKDNEYSYSKFKDGIDAILSKIIDMEKGLEINTAPLRKGFANPNPNADILKRYRELGGEIITIGSDAHVASDIGKDFDTASSILLDCGFKYYTTFEKRIAEFHKL